jgi:Sulfotransferase domain
MTLKVIGAGLGRTGTMSMKLALEALGIGRCYHMIEVFGIPDAGQQWLDASQGKPVSWDKIFEGFSATVDYPSAPFYETLAKQYPQAKVILTLRDADQWFDSTQKTIFKDMDQVVANTANPWAAMVKRIVFDSFDGRIHDRAHATAMFRAHNERVKQVIPPERLLVYEVGDGWEPLCKFLGLPVPATPFPKTNTSEDFARMHAQRVLEQAQGKPA